MANTSLLVAAANGHIDVVSHLVSLGSDTNARAYWDHEYSEMTPLHKAAHFGQEAIVSVLVRAGAIPGQTSAFEVRISESTLQFGVVQVPDHGLGVLSQNGRVFRLLGDYRQ